MKRLEVGCKAMIINCRTSAGRKDLWKVVTVEAIFHDGERFNYRGHDIVMGGGDGALVSGDLTCTSGVVGEAFFDTVNLMRIDDDFPEESPYKEKELEI